MRPNIAKDPEVLDLCFFEGGQQCMSESDLFFNIRRSMTLGHHVVTPDVTNLRRGVPHFFKAAYVGTVIYRDSEIPFIHFPADFGAELLQ